MTSKTTSTTSSSTTVSARSSLQNQNQKSHSGSSLMPSPQPSPTSSITDSTVSSLSHININPYGLNLPSVASLKLKKAMPNLKRESGSADILSNPNQKRSKIIRSLNDNTPGPVAGPTDDLNHTNIRVLNNLTKSTVSTTPTVTPSVVSEASAPKAQKTKSSNIGNGNFYTSTQIIQRLNSKNIDPINIININKNTLTTDTDSHSLSLLEINKNISNNDSTNTIPFLIKHFFQHKENHTLRASISSHKLKTRVTTEELMDYFNDYFDNDKLGDLGQNGDSKFLRTDFKRELGLLCSFAKEMGRNGSVIGYWWLKE